MSCIVQKFGGTSVATLDRIREVAAIIARTRAEGHRVVAVVSAMAGVTNRFVEYVHNLGAHEGEPEYDRVVSSGEMITAGLLAIALKKNGISAKSYASWQVPIITDDSFGRARIKNVDPSKLSRDVEQDIVPVVCGFQGITESGDITTLGRGGSDFTAVAVASSLDAACEIYSDVDGVYTVDPNLYAKAVRLESVNYDEMIEMAAQGAKVLQEQSVLYAKEKNVVVRVASSFVNNPGTIISAASPRHDVCGLAVVDNLIYLRVTYTSGNCADIVNLLRKNFIRSEVWEVLENEVILSLDMKKLSSAKSVLRGDNRIAEVRQEIVRRESKISIIGYNIDEKKIIKALQDNKILVIAFIKKKIGLDIMIPANQLLKTVAFLHSICGLDR